MPETEKTQCPRCKHLIEPLAFCPYCGFSLKLPQVDKEPEGTESIGPYRVVKSIGKGGMGEVLLAYDTICGRKIALKKVRDDLLGFKQIHTRFLREAHITSQLTHPAIIPIYSINSDKQHTYYTMPFVEGNTLKHLLLTAREKEKNGDKADVLTGSIPYLIRVYLAICQAIAYAHSKSILHRDLKPENIIIGTYGEVLILDWGLAKLISEPAADLDIPMKMQVHSTLAGKVVGTLGYMAPERALGQPANKETDIYSLGVILYQILTLRHPFKRKSLKIFRKNMDKEVLYDPIEAAPHRDIPKDLARIAMKCLSTNPSQRYQSVDSLIRELENYIEGRAEWFRIAELKIGNKADWEFQEHILLAEHTAITRTAEISEWVKLMISKEPFAENIRIETTITLKAGCKGIGILFNVPESASRHQINDGYCLWISTDKHRSTNLLRNAVEVLYVPDAFLMEEQEHQIAIEKVDNTIRFYIDQVEQFNYIGRMPLLGTHVGILARDSNYTLDSLKVAVGTQNIMINCLAIPDTFLAHKDYQKALSEYRRISYAFAGRAEGREAILRAGITLIEQAKATQDPKLYDLALTEFEKLHETPGAPLEYLGKALVYEQMQDYDEEVKCFELAYRRYQKHPLLHTLQDQIIFRLLESSRSDRKAVYQFLLVALCHIKSPLQIPALQNLVNYLKLHWEPLEFLYPPLKDDIHGIILTLAFWSHKNYILEENINEDDLISPLVLLIALNEKTSVLEILDKLPLSRYQQERKILAPLLCNELVEALELLPDTLDEQSQHMILLLLDRALEEKNTAFVHKVLGKVKTPLNLALQCRKLFAYLLDFDLDSAGALIANIPSETLYSESTLMHFLYGCWLFATEGQDIANIHWNSVLESPFPRSCQLGSLYLTGKLDPSWYKRAFDFERWQLQRQLALVEALKQRLIK